MKRTPDFDTAELDLQSRLSPRESDCPPISVLRALQEECLPEELARPAREHLSRCPLCRMLLVDMDALSEPQFSPAQQQRIAAILPNNVARSSFWTVQRSLIGLAAALLVMVGLFFWSHRVRGVETASTTSSNAAVHLQVKTLPFTPLASPSGPEELLTRGAGSGEVPSNEELLPAFRAYNHADYSGAVQNFETLSVRYPQSQLILLYLGVSQLALQRDQEAAATLYRAQATPRPYNTDAVQWYSAVAASRTHSKDTRPLLEGLCQRKTSSFSERSCQALYPAVAGR
jgi:hypothetical protein